MVRVTTTAADGGETAAEHPTPEAAAVALLGGTPMAAVLALLPLLAPDELGRLKLRELGLVQQRQLRDAVVVHSPW